MRPAFGESALHEVVLAGGDAAGEQQHVGLESLLDQFLRGFFVVLCDRKNEWITARAPHLCRNGVRIRVPDLMGGRGFGDPYDLIARCDDGNSWARVNGDTRVAGGCDPRHACIADASALWQHDRSLAGLAGRRRDVRSARLGTIRFDRPVGVPHGVFHHKNGVRAFGHRRTGHDFDRFAGFDGAGKTLARANLTDDAKTPRYIGGSNGKAISRRPVEGRIIAVGRDVFGKYATLAGLDRHDFPGRQNARGQHFPKHD